MDSAITPQRDDAADQAFAEVFPNGLPPARPTSTSALVRSFPLEESHLLALGQHAESGKSLGVSNNPLRRISNTHHRLAQMLAGGMDESRAAIVCRYTPSSVSILKTDPAFQELLAYYASQVEDEFRDVMTEMADLHMDLVIELRRRLDESPEQFTPSTIIDAVKTLSDRTGHGPTSNTNNTTTTLSVSAEQLIAIKAAANGQQGRPSGPLPVLTSENQRIIDGVFSAASNEPTRTDISQGVEPSKGTGVREKDSGDVDDATLPLPFDLSPMDRV